MIWTGKLPPTDISGAQVLQEALMCVSTKKWRQHAAGSILFQGFSWSINKRVAVQFARPLRLRIGGHKLYRSSPVVDDLLRLSRPRKFRGHVGAKKVAPKGTIGINRDNGAK